MVDREQGRRADSAENRVASQDTDCATDLGAVSPSEKSDSDREFERAMELGRQVMRDHHAVLAALAK